MSRRRPRKMPQFMEQYRYGTGPILVSVKEYDRMARWMDCGARKMGRAEIDRYPHSFRLLFGRPLQIEC